MTQKALKLALEALECALSDHRPYIVQCKEAITAIKAALAQPPQSTWVGLTDEEIKTIWGSYFSRGLEFAKAIEAKLKEKNT